MNLLWINQKTDLDDSGLGVAIDWISNFAGKFDKIYVITHEAGRLPKIDNVEIVSVGKELGYSKFRRAWELYRHSWRILNDHKIHGCFVHMVPIFGVMLAPLLRLKGIPVLQWYTHKHTSLILRLICYFANHILTASHESVSLKSPKILVTGHGIDIDLFRPENTKNKDIKSLRKAKKIITVGRISPVKKLDVLISIARELRQNGLAFELSIIGEARGNQGEAYLTALKRKVKENNLEQFVHFVGSIPRRELPNWYQNADFFINLCVTGGLDKAVMEAMCCYTPILTSNTTFKPMLKQIAPATFLSKNDKKELLNGIKYWLGLPEHEKNDVVKKMRLWVENNHSLTAFVDKVFAIFKRLQ